MPRYSEPEEYEDDTVYWPVDDDQYPDPEPDGESL